MLYGDSRDQIPYGVYGLCEGLVHNTAPWVPTSLPQHLHFANCILPVQTTVPRGDRLRRVSFILFY